MARKLGSRNIRTIEFVQMFDELSEQYGNPVEVLFIIANRKRNIDANTRVQAAKALLPYRFPRLTAENVQQEQGELTLVWSDGKEVG